MQRHLIFIFFLLELQTPTLAFVENVTHGYVNCQSCHLSPSGGGILNDYGRTLSAEMMSTWSWNQAEEPLFGLIKNQPRLYLGGDYRHIQTFVENANIKQKMQFDMQKNFELAVNFARVWFVSTFGTQEGPNQIENKGEFLSENHYLLWNITDEQKIRVGKFRLTYGLNDSNHTRYTKSFLGFGSLSESYIFEFSNMNEVSELFISSDMGDINIPRESVSEKSFSVSYFHYIKDNSKLGFHTLIGESPQKRRTLYGASLVHPLFEKIAIKTEAHIESSHMQTDSNQQNDLGASMIQIKWEAIKGVSPYIVAENLHTNLKDSKTAQSSHGFGIQWLPIPHINLQAEYKKEFKAGSSTKLTDSAWFQFHFYL